MGKNGVMYSIILVIITACLIAVFIKGSNNHTVILKTFAETLEKHDATISEWSLYAREERKNVTNLREFQAYQKSMSKEFPKMKWTFQENDGKKKYIGVQQFDSFIQERIVVTLDSSSTYVIFEAKGSAYNESMINDYKNAWAHNIAIIFRSNPTTFSCVKGELNDKMLSSLSKQTEYLLKDLNARSIESINEGTFVSVSAYNNKWMESISLNNKEKMNVQLALRQISTNQTFVTLGMPIITSEY